MLELEKTFLLKKIPSRFGDSPYKEIQDIYIPGKHKTAQIRFRKTDKNYNFTKKCPTNLHNRSTQEEKTITIDHEEFDYISHFISNKIIKHRYYLDYQGLTIEIDVFLDDLAGLIMADVEFPDEETKEHFQIPDFCLCEVTQDITFTGGLLCGKSYEDIEDRLEELGYEKLNIN